MSLDRMTPECDCGDPTNHHSFCAVAIASEEAWEAQIITTKEVQRRFAEIGFDAASVNLRSWLACKPVPAPNIVAEMRWWLRYFGAE